MGIRKPLTKCSELPISFGGVEENKRTGGLCSNC